MVILDTSLWIEFFKKNTPYFERVDELLDRNEVIGLSFIFGELLQGSKNQRERQIISDFWDALPKIDETGIFIKAGYESGRHKWLDKGIGIIDSAIVLASIESNSFVWTLDQKLSRILSNEQRFTPLK
ncbi:MAG: PIN domain-containing protein [Chitinispirillaceae bacterium]|nr:PIN domain-containing protein [Chitinispirillaceae bacterium]